MRRSLTLVVTAPGTSKAVVRAALDEATAIWSPAGLALEWRPSTRSALAIEPSTVNVIVESGRDSVPDQDMPIGWITFGPSGRPEGTVHLSQRNAMRLLDATDNYRSRPARNKESLLARALGRALAHELGHYLMASKDHSRSGLMKGRRFADEFFSPIRSLFRLSENERRLVVHELALRAAQSEALTETTADQGHERPASSVCGDTEAS